MERRKLKYWLGIVLALGIGDMKNLRFIHYKVKLNYECIEYFKQLILTDIDRS